MSPRIVVATWWAIVSVVGVPACGDSAVEADDVRIEIDRRAGRLWTASGRAIDDGRLCAEGSQFLVDFLELDGTPMTLADYDDRREAAIMALPPDVTTDHLQVMEFACADGTGAFTLVVEERNDGPWHVRSGTGAYRTLSGWGTLMVEREQVDASWAPPGGVPRYDRLTGTLEFAAQR